MILIPKSLTKSRNYRGIALSRLFPEISDQCITSCEHVALISDGIQFAYESGMSIIQSAYVVTYTINYYLYNKIYMCVCVLCVQLMDASSFRLC